LILIQKLDQSAKVLLLSCCFICPRHFFLVMRCSLRI
jgi:hypothetical protein